VRNTITYLTLHGVGDGGYGAADAEDYWLGSAAFASVLALVATCPHLRVTFDDGFRSDVEIALPALMARGLTARFFVLAGRLADPRHLSARDIRELHAAGMLVGSHGLRHRKWTSLDKAALRAEVADSKQQLEDLLGVAVAEAACPFGAYDRRVLRALRDAGYRCVFTSDRGCAPADAWLRPRTTIRRHDASDLAARLTAGQRRPLTSTLRQLARRWF
jgi:peptidoglycan/xylan/chitin deacetylase (PgdA/CDA1 family)